MRDFRKLLSDGKLHLSDGSWGVFLQNVGLRPGECPEEWCVSHRDAVTDVARAYAAAGSECVKTDSFGASPAKLAAYGLADRCEEIARAAAACSREGAGEDVFVLGSMGPTGKFLLMEDITPEEMEEGFARQAAGLAAGGADALLCETMTDPEEAAIAVAAAKKTGLPVIATFTFDATAVGYRTMMGADPEGAARRVLEAGADAVGCNCGNGMERSVEIMRILRAALPDTPLVVHANAGTPRLEGGKNVFPETPGYMASFLPELAALSVSLAGGCCGTLPEHIRAMKDVLSKLDKA